MEQKPDPGIAEFFAGLSDADRRSLIEAELDVKDARIEASRKQLVYESLLCRLQRRNRLDAETE